MFLKSLLLQKDCKSHVFNSFLLLTFFCWNSLKLSLLDSTNENIQSLDEKYWNSFSSTPDRFSEDRRITHAKSFVSC